MQLEFFPSRTLTLYLARLFVTRILGVLLMLVLILQLLDLLGESGRILNYPGNGNAQLWHYVWLRWPQLVAQFLPYSVLLATLFTFFPLNQNSEIIAMRAAGLSAHQILAPMLLTATVVAGVSFSFNELVVTRYSGQLKAWQDADYGPVKHDGARSNVYITDGRDILAARSVTGTGPAMQMDNVTWYVRDAGGMIVSRYRSPHASWANPGWRLDSPTRFDVATTTTTTGLPATVVGTQITPGQVQISNPYAEGMNIAQLTRTIWALRDNGRRTAELEGKWWHKLSKPLSAILMPLLGAVAAFGLARSGQLLIRAVIGMALGFTYFVVDNAALALGNFGAYPPLIAAWTPFLLFLAVGETVLIRTEE